MADEVKQEEAKKEVPTAKQAFNAGIGVLKSILKDAPESILGEQAALAFATLAATQDKQPGVYVLAGIYLAALEMEGERRGVDVKKLAASNIVSMKVLNLTGTGKPMAQA